MKKLLLLTSLVLGCWLAAPTPASAQVCTSVRATSYELSWTGQWRWQVKGEDLSQCDQIESSVWYPNESSFGCLPGSTHDGTACVKVANGIYQVVYAGARVNGCGPNDVEVLVRGHIPGTNFSYIFAGSGYTTNAPCPGPPPEEGCFWNPGYDNPGDGYWSCSPIVIYTGPRADLRYRLTSLANGVNFDIDADGITDHVSWTRPGDPIAFLALDRNGNGIIDNGSELFGSNTLPGVGDGFTALSQLAQAANGGIQRGTVSALDGAFYDSLLLWTDLNHDGFSQPTELTPFKNQFSSISLSRSEKDREDRFGNEFRYKGYVQERTAPGLNKVLRGENYRNRKIFDVFLVKE